MLLLASACDTSTEPQLSNEQQVEDEDIVLARQIAAAVVDACPQAAPDDEDARDTCADNLTDLALLRDTMTAQFFWGGQKADAGYEISDSNTTHFNPLVWRRMYLSTFWFTGDYWIEKTDDLTVIHLAHRFRNAMDVGAYPYPFWHSKDKWDSYQQSVELLLFVRDGQLIGSLRSEEKDTTRPMVDHEWDGRWRWTDANGEEPYVTLYAYLFTPDNPHVDRLDQAYRAFEDAMRTDACETCHSPANPSAMNPLELFSYPNQAISARHDIVAALQRNTMPPSAGIADGEHRARLLELARAFADAADDALAYEGEPAAIVTTP